MSDDDTSDELSGMLADGWEICGYTVNMLAMGRRATISCFAKVTA